MKYTELLKGVNAYASSNRNCATTFPTSLYPEEILYLDTIYGTQPISERAQKFLRHWNRRVPIDDHLLQTAYQAVPQNLLTCNLQNADLWLYKASIIETFSAFINAVRYTGASKALHIVNPEFFMMWDVNIRHGYGCYDNAESYFNFLLRSQIEILEVIKTYQTDYSTSEQISLRIYMGRVKSVAKLLDEYNHARYYKKWI